MLVFMLVFMLGLGAHTHIPGQACSQARLHTHYPGSGSGSGKLQERSAFIVVEVGYILLENVNADWWLGPVAV